MARAAAVDLTDVPGELRGPVAAALAAVGVEAGHVAVELVGAERIRQLNREHRGRDAPTDVLAFPLDELGPTPGPRELGDVIVCPEHCSDVTEAAVHGILHLCGYDHETDDGEMLELQARVLGGLQGGSGMSGREAEDMAVGDKAPLAPGSGPDLTFPGAGAGPVTGSKE